ncbi:MAG: heptaprenyl diphosphate synthase [Clostridiales bacterium]|nr:MAG: heptaprenyl diphosphate synthase [Clostridiales bacterium]
MQSSTKKLTTTAILIAVSMILSYLEMLLPISYGFPGVKLGLANLVIVVSIYMYGPINALIISILRVILMSITFGNMTILMYSLVGALFGISFMIISKRVLSLSIIGVSIVGGVFHNVGQLLVAMLFISNFKILYYLPILLIFGLVSGFIIGLLSKLVYARLR